MVAIVTADGKMFDISDAVSKQINLLRNVAEDILDEIIPLPNVNSTTLDKIVEFCTFKTGDHGAGDTEYFTTNFFDNMPVDTLFDIIAASNFLDAPDVLDAACSAAANLLGGKNPEEIRNILKIDSQFTPEEEAEIMKENSWAFEPKITYHQAGNHH